MSQQSEMADRVLLYLDKGMVPTAQIVSELRDKWGAEHGVLAVHGFAREVATCLLWTGDVEVGDIQSGRFIPWAVEPEDANSRIDEELMSMSLFLDDATRYVFRKKLPNQSPEPTSFTAS